LGTIEMTRLALLTPYPFKTPRHGGQIRAARLCEQFRAMGWSVDTLSIVADEKDPDRGPRDIVVPRSANQRAPQNRAAPFIDDLLACKYLDDADVRNMVWSQFPADIDIIHVEQPWAWPLAMHYRQEINKKTILSYGSQNVESTLKQRILEDMMGDEYEDELPLIIAEIDALERRATVEADVVACVSPSDKVSHETWGARKLVVATNGFDARTPAAAKMAEWKNKLGEGKFLVYVASAHPPNFTRFSEIIGQSLACFPPDTRLVVVGSVTEHILHQCRIGPFASVNQSRLVLLHELGPEDLDAVKALAHGFFLPIPFGGGTNLKTAEALASSGFIIGTDAAFRGYKTFKDQPGIFVCETPANLHEAVRAVMSIDVAPAANTRARRMLTWDRCLRPLMDVLRQELEAR
jgi:hypothetical protein